MTKKELKHRLESIRRVAKEVTASAAASKQFLMDAGFVPKKVSLPNATLASKCIDPTLSVGEDDSQTIASIRRGRWR